MNVTLYKSKAEGRVLAPPSKSIAHRALICGALSDASRIGNIVYSKDISATAECLRILGANVTDVENGVEIGGLDLSKTKDGCELYCNESGSTLRFMIPICLLTGKTITLKGAKRLFERPLTVYEDICKKQGIVFDKGVDSLMVCGKLKAGDYSVPGDVSSQFITGLLFALSLIGGKSTLEVTGKYESRSYVDLTLDVMKNFGVTVNCHDNVYYIDGGHRYFSTDYNVEGDCSNAAFLEGFNLLDGNVDLVGINPNTVQGDRVYLSMFDQLKEGKKQFDLSDCPDLAPVMFALAAYFGGAEFSGTSRLKIKESDRASAMAEELFKFGIDVMVEDDRVIVHKGELHTPTEVLKGHNDHRIVMALSLLCSVTGGVISDAEAVTKSFPDFFEVIETLGVKVKR